MTFAGENCLSELDAALAAIKEALEANPFFSDVPVIVDDDLDLENKVAQALASAGGVSAVIGVPELVNDHPNVPGPLFGEAKIAVAVQERPALNRAGGTRKPARRVAEEAARTLHHRRIPFVGKALVVESISAADVDEKAGTVTFAVVLATGGISLKPIQPPTPPTT